ncbi:MAG TPA: hypothetical protein VLU99_07580 [Nitrososphaerales archaeon]|nr:hypothetical protein [Nitrososphaerales archaeon]HUK75637.1 hypothetical protein [Nitrososphaerales archaeon]
MPAKKSKPKAKAKAAAKPKAKPAGSGQGATIECAECSGQFTANVALANFEKEVGKKFNCPKCGALYEIISLQESRITVTILAKGETRTYGKTYDLATKPFAKPL